MAVRVLVGDRSGRLVGELTPDMGPVSWKLNEVGQVRFGLARTDPKAIDDYLQFGNRLLVQYDNGLPDWGGIIDPPREWANGMVNCTAYSGEYLLGTRITDKGRYFRDATVGYIFESLIREATEIGLEIGEVWDGGIGHSPDYHFKDLLSIIRDSVCKTLSAADFVVTPSIVAGKIVLTANLYERRGSDLAGVALIEGANITSARLIEQGTIANKWSVAGRGSSWGDDRITSYAEDADSIAEYGLREDSQVFVSVSLQQTLDEHAVNLLAESKDPHNMLELATIDAEPAGFEAYDVGDSVSVMLPSYGFSGTQGMVRVHAREYEARTGVCKLVVREDE
jgi:hypothetical protein